ncbi:hypothetical protein BV22DRAFT_1199760 [Leucogyrophana mollusca]|uniref:Uncharacterized protein n=1 Tax=Leucogyrophana mollusca TaxID=85980 RepID=A0ACB8AZV8_9AGAM|nr:hypothetical protein BV22DRAFT_1199760 [Leucogyrophana mollusca]
MPSSPLSRLHVLLTFSDSPEYITTLGGDIAERDHPISAIHTELGSSQSQSETSPSSRRSHPQPLFAPRRQHGASRPHAATPPPPFPPPLPRCQIQSGRRRKRPDIFPTKTSPSLGLRAPFWGSLGSGVTRAHDTRPTPRGVECGAGGEGERPRRWWWSLGGFNIDGTQSFNNAAGGFDSFAGINPTGKCGFDDDGLDPNCNDDGEFTGQEQQGRHVGGLHPLYFALELGKDATAPAPSYSSSAPSGKDTTPPTVPTKEHAYAPALASQTLLGKPGEDAQGPGLLGGTTVVQVVDVKPVPTVVTETMDIKPIVKGATAKPAVVPDAKPVSSANPSPCGTKIAGDVCAFLESMRSLTLAKK